MYRLLSAVVPALCGLIALRCGGEDPAGPEEASTSDYEKLANDYEARCLLSADWVSQLPGCGVAFKEDRTVSDSSSAFVDTPTALETLEELIADDECRIHCSWLARSFLDGETLETCSTQFKVIRADGPSIREVENLTSDRRSSLEECRTR